MIDPAWEFQTIPVEKWPLGYRFTDERYNKLDAATLETIRSLDDADSLALSQLHDFQITKGLAQGNSLGSDWLVAPIDENNLDATRKWLRAKRPAATDDVYMYWSYAPVCAAIAAWPTFCDFFDDFWYPFEVVLVTDDTRKWEVILGPNDFVGWRDLPG
jgi:hypothetical protein